MIYICKSVNFTNDKTYKDFIDTVKEVNQKGYDYLYVKVEAYSDSDKENFFHSMIEINALAEVPVIVEFPLTHFEDMKKLYYANSSLIVSSEGTTLDDSVIEDGKKRFGEKLIISVKDFVVKTSDELLASSSDNKDSYVLITEDTDVFALKDSLNSKGYETKSLKPAYSWDELKKNEDGLVPVIVIDYKTDKILMMADMNEAAYYNTLKTGRMNYYSRSRKSQWIKGETSGHFQYVKSMKADCDMDTLLASVSQIGVPCHTGKDTCFFNDVLKDESVQKNPSKILTDLYKVIEDRKVNPKEGSYTNYLFDKGLDKILKKVGEEACEIVIASKNEEPKEIKYEIADFLYHLSVLMVEKNVTWEEVAEELSKR